MANQPERYAATEATERLVLAGLPWTGSLQAAYCLNLSNPIAKVRTEMRRVYGPQMQGLDAKLARLSAYSADESAAALTLMPFRTPRRRMQQKPAPSSKT